MAREASKVLLIRILPVGQFQDFDLSLGVLPTSGEMVFKAVQTYSSGEKVRWAEVPVNKSAPEPAHPAPILTLTAPVNATGSTAPPDKASGNSSPQASAPTDTLAPVSDNVQSDSSSVLPLTLSGIALLISIAGVTLAFRRTRT